MSLADVCQHLVENLVRLGVVGDVLEAEDILEALAVVSEDLLAGGLVEKLRWQLLSKRQLGTENGLKPLPSPREDLNKIWGQI